MNKYANVGGTKVPPVQDRVIVRPVKGTPGPRIPKGSGPRYKGE